MFVNKKVSHINDFKNLPWNSHFSLWGVNSQASDEEPLGLPAAVCVKSSFVFSNSQNSGTSRFPAMFMDYVTQIF